MKSDIKSILTILLNIFIIGLIIFIVGKLFIFLLPIIIVLIIIYYIYRIYCETKIKVNANKKDKNVKNKIDEAEVINEKFDK